MLGEKFEKIPAVMNPGTITGRGTLMNSILCFIFKSILGYLSNLLINNYKIHLLHIKWIFSKDKSVENFIYLFFNAERLRFQQIEGQKMWIAKIDLVYLESVLHSCNNIVTYTILGKTNNAMNEQGVLLRLEI